MRGSLNSKALNDPRACARALTMCKAPIVCALVCLQIVLLIGAAFAANGSVVYTYDALGRMTTASYDTGVLVIYIYDANGNRTQQVINVNTAPAVWGQFNWGQALWQ